MKTFYMILTFAIATIVLLVAVLFAIPAIKMHTMLDRRCSCEPYSAADYGINSRPVAFTSADGVELGAYEIIPVSCKRCVVKLDEKKQKTKIQRWQGISEAAAKQSKRRVIPQIKDVMSFSQAVEYAKEMNLKLIPYEMQASEAMAETKKLIESAKPGDEIAIFIGPEGGFDESEVTKAFEAGIVPVSLGKRILRTETAGFTTIAWLMYQLEE